MKKIFEIRETRINCRETGTNMTVAYLFEECGNMEADSLLLLEKKYTKNICYYGYDYFFYI